MVYKRYIKRNGKLCGPYYYESYRGKDGKVKSRYLKNYKPKKKVKEIAQRQKLFLSLSLLGLILIFVLISGSSEVKVTGKASFSFGSLFKKSTPESYFINVTNCAVLDFSGATYSLINDLATNNLEGVCFEIVSNDIVLDLNGHTLDNTGGKMGVAISGKNVDNITIKNGDVSGFQYAVYLEASSQSNVHNMNFNDNENALQLISNLYTTVRDVVMVSNSIGAQISSGRENRFENLVITNGYIGLSVSKSPGNIFDTVDLSGNTNNLFINMQDPIDCNQEFLEITIESEGLNYYNNTPVNLRYKNLTTLILCNADNSNVNNLEITESLLITGTDNSVFSDIVTSKNQYGFYLHNSMNNDISKITANSNSVGLYIYDSSNNFIRDVEVLSNYIGIYFYSSSENTLENVIASPNSYGLQLRKSSNNKIRNAILSGSEGYDIWLGESSVNNMGINLSYDESAGNENVSLDSELIRGWYYSAFVADDLGKGAGPFKVELYNYSGDLVSSISTNDFGRSNKTEIIEYVNKYGKKSYSTPYMIRVSNITHIFTKQVDISSNFLSDLIEVNDRPDNLLIYDVNAYFEDSDTGIVEWKTDQKANSEVISWGVDVYEERVYSSEYVTQHSLKIFDLGNIAYFNITSCNFDGVCVKYGPDTLFRILNEGTCAPRINCSAWSACPGQVAGILQKRICSDENGCVNIGYYEETRDCGIIVDATLGNLGYTGDPWGDLNSFGLWRRNQNCRPNWSCGAWDDCRVVYGVEALIKEDMMLKEEKQRLCIDLNDCNYNLVQRAECETKQPITLGLSDVCQSNYLEIYDITGALVSRLNSDRENVLNINFPLSNNSYCPYCYDGVKNYDEDEIDCSHYEGSNCPVCFGEARSFSYSYISMFLLALMFVSILMVSWYMFLTKTVSVKKRKILNLSGVEKREVDNYFKKTGDATRVVLSGKGSEKLRFSKGKLARLKEERLNELKWVQLAVQKGFTRQQVDESLKGLGDTIRAMMLSDYERLISLKSKKLQDQEIAWIKDAIKKNLDKKQIDHLLSPVDWSKRQRILKTYDRMNKEKRILNRGGDLGSVKRSWEVLSVDKKLKDLNEALTKMLEKQRRVE